jgi:hypothetical protein
MQNYDVEIDMQNIVYAYPDHIHIASDKRRVIDGASTVNLSETPERKCNGLVLFFCVNQN